MHAINRVGVGKGIPEIASNDTPSSTSVGTFSV